MIKTPRKYPFLLPKTFKKVGYGLLIMTIIFMIQAVILKNIEADTFKAIATSGLVSSFLILALIEFEDEDERSIHIRLICWFATMIFISVYIIIAPFISLVFDSTFVSNVTAVQLLISMFVFYFLTMFITTKFYNQ